MKIQNNDTLRRVLAEFNLPDPGDEFELDDSLAYWIEGAHAQQTHVEYEHQRAIGICRALSHQRNEALKAAPVASTDVAPQSAPIVPSVAVDLGELATLMMVQTQLLTEIRDRLPSQPNPLTGRITMGAIIGLVLLVLTVLAFIK